MATDQELVELGLGSDLGREEGKGLLVGQLEEGLAGLLHVVLGAADGDLDREIVV